MIMIGKYGNNMAGLRKAVNKAGLRLMYVERYEDRTVYHDFFTQYGKTKIIVRQQPPGFGVSNICCMFQAPQPTHFQSNNFREVLGANCSMAPLKT